MVPAAMAAEAAMKYTTPEERKSFIKWSVVFTVVTVAGGTALLAFIVWKVIAFMRDPIGSLTAPGSGGGRTMLGNLADPLGIAKGVHIRGISEKSPEELAATPAVAKEQQSFDDAAKKLQAAITEEAKRRAADEMAAASIRLANELAKNAWK